MCIRDRICTDSTGVPGPIPDGRGSSAPAIDWKRVTAFHMDEYVGLDAAAPQGFGNFLRARVFDRLPFGQV